jgi:4-hydroxy-tetrahydrodipicolinate synthase
MNTKKQTFRGIITPMITPLTDTDRLDERGVENLVEHLITAGVNAIFILGTTGEAQHVSIKIKAELIQKTATYIRGRVPMLVGITDTSVYESIRIAEIAAKNRASAVVAAPPYYFTLGQPELIEYYELLAEKSPLPLYLYNMPAHTKTMIDVDTAETLSKHKNIIGLKDSSASGVYFNKLLTRFKDRPDFGLFVGPEEMMASMVLMGAHGGVSGGANVYPKIFVDLYKAASNKDVSKTIELQSKMMAIGQHLYGIGRFGSSYIKGIKTALSLKGICSDFLAQPFNLFKEPEKEKVKTAVKHLDKLLLS